MARPNAKSVRLSDEALAIVEGAEGKGFNDKFENLIFAYKKTIPQRQAQLEAINKRIEKKKKELETLQAQESKVRSLVIDLEVIANLIPRVAKSLNNVSQEIDQAQAAGDKIEIHKDVKRFQDTFSKFKN